MTRHMVIAIDGPAASGKSSTAKRIASRLGFRHVDSGAFYRAATAARARQGGKAGEWTEESVLDAASCVTIRAEELGFTTLLDGKEVDEELRGDQVTANVSRVAAMPAVRGWVNAQVRLAARDHDVVVDGRDIGTVVFPGAELKIFLVADPWERAKRRLRQQTLMEPDSAQIAEETERIVQRDSRDANQTVQARDAILIDTTHLTQPEQVDRIVALARAARKHTA